MRNTTSAPQNPLSEEIQQLVKQLQANDPTLIGLCLGPNQIGDAGAKAFAKALQHNATLISIELNGSQIGNAGAKAFAKALQHNATLTEIDLRGNQIGTAGAQALAEALQHNASLTWIHLGVNQIGDAGAKALAEALQQNTSLTTIDLGANQLGDAGAQALAEALQHNTSLTSIDLGFNRIDAPGGKALAEALKHNTSLTWIHLGFNQIGDTGAKALAEALQHNTSLTWIYLEGNNISAALEKTIADLLSRNRVLATTKNKPSAPPDTKPTTANVTSVQKMPASIQLKVDDQPPKPSAVFSSLDEKITTVKLQASLPDIHFQQQVTEDNQAIDQDIQYFEKAQQQLLTQTAGDTKASERHEQILLLDNSISMLRVVQQERLALQDDLKSLPEQSTQPQQLDKQTARTKLEWFHRWVETELSNIMIRSLAISKGLASRKQDWIDKAGVVVSFVADFIPIAGSIVSAAKTVFTVGRDYNHQRKNKFIASVVNEDLIAAATMVRETSDYLTHDYQNSLVLLGRQDLQNLANGATQRILSALTDENFREDFRSYLVNQKKHKKSIGCLLAASVRLSKAKKWYDCLLFWVKDVDTFFVNCGLQVYGLDETLYYCPPGIEPHGYRYASVKEAAESEWPLEKRQKSTKKWFELEKNKIKLLKVKVRKQEKALFTLMKEAVPALQALMSKENDTATSAEQDEKNVSSLAQLNEVIAKFDKGVVSFFSRGAPTSASSLSNKDNDGDNAATKWDTASDSDSSGYNSPLEVEEDNEVEATLGVGSTFRNAFN